MPARASPSWRRCTRSAPNDFNILADLLRGYARLGQMDKAVALAAELAEPASAALRVNLGDSLFAAQDYELAAVIYAQVLAADPNATAAQLGLIRVDIREYRLPQALRELDTSPGKEGNERLYALAWGEYHQAAGEYSEAVRPSETTSARTRATASSTSRWRRFTRRCRTTRKPRRNTRRPSPPRA